MTIQEYLQKRPNVEIAKEYNIEGKKIYDLKFKNNLQGEDLPILVEEQNQVRPVYVPSKEGFELLKLINEYEMYQELVD